jgi:hypothetical protein
MKYVWKIYTESAIMMRYFISGYGKSCPGELPETPRVDVCVLPRGRKGGYS